MDDTIIMDNLLDNSNSNTDVLSSKSTKTTKTNKITKTTKPDRTEKNEYMRQYRKKNNEKIKEQDLSYYYRDKFNITDDQFEIYRGNLTYVVKLKNIIKIMNSKCPDILNGLILDHFIEQNKTDKLLEKIITKSNPDHDTIERLLTNILDIGYTNRDIDHLVDDTHSKLLIDLLFKDQNNHTTIMNKIFETYDSNDVNLLTNHFIEKNHADMIIDILIEKKYTDLMLTKLTEKKCTRLMIAHLLDMGYTVNKKK